MREVGVTGAMAGDTLVRAPDPEKHVKVIPVPIGRAMSGRRGRD